MCAVAAAISLDERRIARLEARVRYLPQALDRAKAKVVRLEAEAISLGLHDLAELTRSAEAGDLIAAEWLRRFGR